MRAISADRMSYKDASAKQTQDYCDFNHFNAPIYYGYVDSRSRFRAGFVGAGKWFRLMPRRGPWSAAIPASRRRRSRRAAGERGGRDLEHQAERVDRQCDRLPQLQQPGCICGHLVIMQAQH